ncbi:MAG: GGDEF domain-containing response regulator [Sterolibacteriaceae bacterium MAG5]|nr:GGDEF domain-containing response regulator [Candidatus Nitricoxidireducens bremensis]
MLIVEDSEDEAFLLYSELNARGVRLDWKRVDTARDLTAVLAAGEWDIIICDHNMPGFDSFAALQIVKQSGKDIPFIIYSGQISDQQAVSAMHDGVQDYIEKGNYARLMPVIERELKNAASRRAVRQADNRIQELAYYDTLSSLPNHTLFCARVTEWILEAEKRGKTPGGAIFYLDLDRFLRINSSFGYDTGNEILRQIAERLKQSVDQKALVARLSGDAFGIFLPEDEAIDSLNSVAQWVKQAFDAPFEKKGFELYVTASMGIARLPEDGGEVYELLMNAETAMAYAKRLGGNGFQFYRRDMNANSGERVAMESDLRHAVERDELFLQYQPCIDAGTARTVGMEALVRWQHPTRGLIPPDRFIPIADESGLIVGIGEWVLRQACAQAKIWNDKGYGIYVAVNVSAVQFGQPRLLEVVSRALAETGLAPEALQLEITESVLMQDAESAIGMLRAFKGMGVRISVDDFGTGYSSLSYLKRFPIDILKIDKSFVRDLPEDEEDTAIVRAIIALARSLRLTTVAEGVETGEQRTFLDGAGCNRFQGYFFSRPIDVEAMNARLETEKNGKISA